MITREMVDAALQGRPWPEGKYSRLLICQRLMDHFETVLSPDEMDAAQLLAGAIAEPNLDQAWTDLGYYYSAGGTEAELLKLAKAEAKG